LSPFFCALPTALLTSLLPQPAVVAAAAAIAKHADAAASLWANLFTSLSSSAGSMFANL
jgi:hypothetical protein